ncbi:hypothetical protein, partial [Pseudomonas sp. NBRC 111137]|uniref:hypothetical protein n=1 Tax=Pseudomonas sp. NBRC 111137 TaxID=1661052 RepID=UPI001C44646D
MNTRQKAFCRSELAREELTGAALIQEASVIVDVFREQARSYRGLSSSPHLTGLSGKNCVVSGL